MGFLVFFIFIFAASFLITCELFYSLNDRSLKQFEAKVMAKKKYYQEQKLKDLGYVSKDN